MKPPSAGSLLHIQFTTGHQVTPLAKYNNIND